MHVQHTTSIGSSIQNQSMDQAERQPEVIAAIERLDRLSYSLADLVLSCSDRLSMIVRPEMANQKGDGIGAQLTGAPLAGHVTMIADRIETQMATLSNILTRLEI